MANKVNYGLSNVYYAKIESRAVDGKPTYATPVRIPGAVSMTVTPTGDATNFYADNGVYFATSANTGYEGTLSIALVPEDFKTDILGEVVVNGMTAEFSNAKISDFALLFQIEGDDSADKLVYYDVTVARPGVTANTTAETIEITPNELTLTVKPRINDYAVKSIASKPAVADPDGSYAKFFTEVQEPVVTP